MTPEEYNDVVMRTIDWYEDLNVQNVRDTNDNQLSSLKPPFLRYGRDNGYSYITPNGNIQRLSSDQQADLRSVIETERTNLRTTRQGLRSQTTANMNVNSNSLLSGGRKKSKKTKRVKKSMKTRKVKKTRKNKRGKK
jgi:hypothetical protein